jgi:hypothetical protein
MPRAKSVKLVTYMFFSSAGVWLNLGKVVSKNPKKQK